MRRRGVESEDTLFDAAEDIRKQRAAAAEAYAPYAGLIDEALAAMERCRAALDTPPAE